MLEDKRALRQQQIRIAAYELLVEKGYKATSMLAIAKRAKASNETLYAWYQNKQNLFKTLIEENAANVKAALEEELDSRYSLEKTLLRIGPLLLELVTGEKAVTLNRAAATDANESGVLGKTLADAGRNSLVPRFRKLFNDAKDQGEIHFSTGDNVTEIYLGLLIGDTQIRRVTGALPPLSKAKIRNRSQSACELFLALYAK